MTPTDIKQETNFVTTFLEVSRENNVYQSVTQATCFTTELQETRGS